MTKVGNGTDRDGLPRRIQEEPQTILVIDDLETVIQVFGAALEAQGFMVISALSGKAGLDKFRANSVDLILCDLGMPHMDGWEVAKQVVEICREQGRAKPPFLLVTAWASQINRDEKLSGSGVDDVLGKPIRLEELTQAVADALHGPGE